MNKKNLEDRVWLTELKFLNSYLKIAETALTMKHIGMMGDYLFMFAKAYNERLGDNIPRKYIKTIREYNQRYSNLFNEYKKLKD
jgi:hypothetical protein